MTPVIVPAYAPPVSYLTWLLQQDTIYWVTDSHYHKQTYRNRAYIYGANGRLTLTIPIVHKRQQSHQKENEVQTDVHSRWQQLHWKSLQAAYRSSPFFEFYEDAFAPLPANHLSRLCSLMHRGFLFKGFLFSNSPLMHLRLNGNPQVS